MAVCRYVPNNNQVIVTQKLTFLLLLYPIELIPGYNIFSIEGMIRMIRNGAESPMLFGQIGPLNGQRWIISETISIGRDESCDIVIPDRQVSRVHARLILNQSGVWLEDLSSKNGTYCNGKKILDRVLLQDSDSLQIALVQEFVFFSSDATLPLGESSTEIGASNKGRLSIDQRSRQVWISGMEVQPALSASQYRLLKILYDQQHKVVSRQDLILSVWGEEEIQGVSEQALDALIRRLRDRLASVDPGHEYIITVRGHGLRLDNPIDE